MRKKGRGHAQRGEEISAEIQPENPILLSADETKTSERLQLRLSAIYKILGTPAPSNVDDIQPEKPAPKDHFLRRETVTRRGSNMGRVREGL